MQAVASHTDTDYAAPAPALALLPALVRAAGRFEMIRRNGQIASFDSALVCERRDEAEAAETA